MPIESPPAAGQRRRPWLGSVLLAGSALLALAAGLCGWRYLFRTEPPEQFASDEEHFKYGTIGSGRGFPLHVFRALPSLFPDKLPAGWATVGLHTEPGHDTPVGFGRTTVGFTGLLPNCALCHSGTYRAGESAAAVLVSGAPAHQLDFDAFNRVVFECAADPRFSPGTLLGEIEKHAKLGTGERLVYRVLLLPQLRNQILKQSRQMGWQKKRPEAGRGRTDAFNRFKINLLGLPDDGSVGTSDYPPLWRQQDRVGCRFHWNGSGSNVVAENLMSVLPVIGDPKTWLPDNFARITNFVWQSAPPKFPFPLEANLVTRGEKVFGTACARCHAPGQPQFGQVTPQTEVGTDPSFLGMWTPAFVDALRGINHPPFQFPEVQVTDGYVNVPLDGLWLRAPYLHNGSVPTLAALLQPPEQRPKVFYRGSDVYDPEQMGFRSGEPTAGERGFRYDTALPGNGNQGHTYGTDLPADEKRALLEYLKTL